MRQSLSRLGQVALQRPQRSSSSNGPIPRRRFVQDGDVPTTYTHAGSDAARTGADPSEAVEAAQAELQRERGTHAETRDALKQAQATIQRLQTRLGHMELEMQETRERAEQSVVAALQAEREVATRVPRPRKAATEVAPRSDEAEPEPVKWWVRD